MLRGAKPFQAGKHLRLPRHKESVRVALHPLRHGQQPAQRWGNNFIVAALPTLRTTGVASPLQAVAAPRKEATGVDGAARILHTSHDVQTRQCTDKHPGVHRKALHTSCKSFRALLSKTLFPDANHVHAGVTSTLGPASDKTS